MKRTYKNLDKINDLLSSGYESTKKGFGKITPDINTVVGVVGLQIKPSGPKLSRAERKLKKAEEKVKSLRESAAECTTNDDNGEEIDTTTLGQKLDNMVDIVKQHVGA